MERARSARGDQGVCPRREGDAADQGDAGDKPGGLFPASAGFHHLKSEPCAAN